MAATIYLACALTAALCAWLLLQSWRRGRYRLLLWSGLCFCGLALNNLLLVIDKLVLATQIDLSLVRVTTSLASMLVLLYGLIFDAE